MDRGDGEQLSSEAQGERVGRESKAGADRTLEKDWWKQRQVGESRS